MANNALHKVIEQAQENRRRNRWKKVVTGMAAFVVFCTTYALILPAITEEREPLCGLEEHVHTDKCWEKPKVLTCTYQKMAEEGTLPLLVHTHDENCYDLQGNLVCALPEVESHVHDYRCYTDVAPEPPHVHTDACYTEERVLTCTLEESEGHTHGDGCYDENGVLICTLEESQGHAHTDSCYTAQKTLTCGKQEATEEELAAYTGEPEKVLTCGKDEVILHQHTQECRDEYGNLTCELNELFAHQHSKECWTTTRDPDAEKVLTCGLVEHTHDDTCYTDLEADLETPEMWEAALPELTGNWPDDLLAVALTQLGYEQSKDNVTLTPEGLVLNYTRYGQWAGVPYGPWSLNFLDFCHHYAGIPADAFPVHEGQLRWCEQLKEENWNIYWTPEQYTPVTGDTVFLDENVDGTMDAAAIVWEYQEATEEAEAALTVIQGDADGAVQKLVYKPDDPVILGYGSLSAAKSRWDALNPPPAPEPTRYCGLEEHTHGEDCYDAEGTLVCQLPEHTHSQECLTAPVIYHCGLEEHTHDENCYDNEGSLKCTLEEHTHTALCQVENPYCCGLEEHQHTETCYDETGILICGKEAHVHGENCMLAQQSIEAQIDALAVLNQDEEETEKTAITVEGLLPNGATIKAVPVSLGEGYENFLCAYDLTVYDAYGHVFELVTPVKVTFRVPNLDLSEYTDLSAGYVPEIGVMDGKTAYGEEEPMGEATLNEDESVSFMAPHFSCYMLTGGLPEVKENGGLIGLLGLSRETGPSYEINENYLGGPVCDTNCDHVQEKLQEFEKGTVTGNPFGEALDFNLFLFGDLDNFGTVHGNAAIGGNIVGSNQGITKDEGSTMDFSNDLVPRFDFGLVLGGNVDVGSSSDLWIKNGSVVANDAAHKQIQMLFSDDFHRHVIDDEAHTAYDATMVNDYFAMAHNAMVGEGEHSNNNKGGINSEFYNYCLEKENGTFHVQTDDPSVEGEFPGTKGDLVLSGTDPFVNIFNIPEKYLHTKDDGTLRAWIVDVPYGSYTMINIVPDEDDSNQSVIEDFGIEMWTRINDERNSNAYVNQPSIQNAAMAQAQRTIFNFAPQFKTLKCTGKTVALYASIMAPDLDLDCSASNARVDLWGTIVLESIKSSATENSSVDNSAIMYYPYQAPGSARIVKSARCEADPLDDAGCQINEIPDWRNTEHGAYFADITLEATDVKVRAVNRFKIEKLPYNPYTGEFSSKDGIDTEFFAPGSYRVVEEIVYKELNEQRLYIDNNGAYMLESGQHCDASGNLIYIDESGDEQSIEDNPDKFVYDPILGNHSYSHAGFKYGDSEYGTIVVESGVKTEMEIVNVYDAVSTDVYAVRKLWQRPLTEAEKGTDLVTQFPSGFMPTPIPEGASVKVQLYQVRTEAISGDVTTLPYGEPIVLSSENNWNYVWLGLPKDNRKGNISCTYYAREIEPWEGYETIHEDFVDTENPDNPESGKLTIIKNIKRSTEEHFLTVDKYWFDENGVLDEDPEQNSLQVDLWQDNGYLKGKGNDAHQVVVRVGSVDCLTNVYTHVDKQGNGCFDGSDVTIIATVYFVDQPTPGVTHWTDLTRFYVNGVPLQTDRTDAVAAQHMYNGQWVYTRTFSTTLTNVQVGTNVDLIEPSSIYGTDKAIITNSSKGENFVPVVVSVEQPLLGAGHIQWDEKVKKIDSKTLMKDDKGNWTYTWDAEIIKLLEPDDSNGFVYHRYFVTESVPDGYTPSYQAMGKPFTPQEYLNLGSAVDGKYPCPGSQGGIPEGYVIIRNTPNPPGGPELPMTGGTGTLPYTLGGLLSVLLAGFLMQYNKKRRKEAPPL